GGGRHDGRRRGNRALSWPRTARCFSRWTDTEALVDARAVEAGIPRTRVAVVAPRRARARGDARLEVCCAGRSALLRRRRAPPETCESIGCGPTTPHACPRLCHHTSRAGRERLAAPIEEGAGARTRRRGR